ncbi:MAG: cytochrome ubiquinol oxidase subunit I [Acidobacteriota bacterium]|nr:cytochrome ubiquinol oxidase subunit I [Blastocatellia bacterium]MDW8239928.1 cytochrome ubiquinol oxidase subunit I [Acidobacteriota bacterium]
MDDALAIDRFQFAFTVTFHYLFPQLTMGLALLIVILKTIAIRRNDERYNQAARFWGKIFAISFVFGVVTGIPMEFQFGTNWAKFSRFAGGVIGQTLAMEGVFAFFLESSFLGLFLFGEKRLGPRGHWLAAFLVFAGSWLSGYFIIATNAWMQHPVGYTIAADGSVHLSSFWALLLNPWAIWQYLHTMGGSVITASFVMAAVGAFYVLTNREPEHGRLFLKLGVSVAVVASVLQLFPTGDKQGRMVALHQPATLAAMEGLFKTEAGAPLVIIGQPNTAEQKLDNPIIIPRLLSFLTYRRWNVEVKGLDAFPKDQWPDNIPLLYYSYHIMVGLGTIFIAITLAAAWLLWRGRLYESKWMLWILMLSFPFPYIANTAGWMTAELGRQPWLVYGLMRTSEGFSPTVSAGNVMFTLLGFMGMYTVLAILYLLLMWREIEHGPKLLAAEASSMKTGQVVAGVGAH